MKEYNYKAFLHGKELDIKATSLYQAKQKAIELFKPKKKDISLIAVVLADKPIDTSGL